MRAARFVMRSAGAALIVVGCMGLSCSANKAASEADDEATAEGDAADSEGDHKSEAGEKGEVDSPADGFGLEDGEEPTVVVTVGMETIEVDGESVVDLEGGQLEDAEKVQSTADLRVDALAEALESNVDDERREAIKEKQEEGVVAISAEPLAPYVTLYRVLRTASSELMPERFAVRIGERPAFAYAMPCKDRSLPDGGSAGAGGEQKTVLGTLGSNDEEDEKKALEALADAKDDDETDGDESGGGDDRREVVDLSEEGEEVGEDEDADRCAKPPSPAARKQLRFDLMAKELRAHRMGWSEPTGGFWSSRAPVFALEEDVSPQWSEARKQYAEDARDEALNLLEEVEASYPWSKLSEPLSHFDDARDEGTGTLVLFANADAPVALLDRAVRLNCLDGDELEEGSAPPVDKHCDARADAVEFLYFPGRQ